MKVLIPFIIVIPGILRCMRPDSSQRHCSGVALLLAALLVATTWTTRYDAAGFPAETARVEFQMRERDLSLDLRICWHHRDYRSAVPAVFLGVT
ncbi:MAG: hypothetical protein AMS18_04665 [Gemmatimonas sp. SG8_17]|nr:MAG: hypothetical protein AMS18_04665 [Gemmatimonas sp. SG8_17]